MLTPAPNASPLQLFAVTDLGPQPLSVSKGGGSVHDLLESMPSGVYSAMRTFGHDRFLWLDEHLARTQRSMDGLGWARKLDAARLRSALDVVVRAYPLDDARVRFDVLREAFSIDGVSADIFIALSPFVAVPEDFMRDGVALDFAPHLQRREPRIKTTDFVRERKPLPLGSKDRYEHVLLDPNGRILECSSSNIAFVRGDELLTAGDGVLEGITLKVLTHLAPRIGLTRRDVRISLPELTRMDECFLSSSARGAVPVIRIGDQRIGDGRVGTRTRALTELYFDFAAENARRAVEEFPA